jgi:hypothetical protein
MGVWRRRGKAASAGLSAAPYSVYHGLYLGAVASSVASAVAFVEVGLLREAVEYVQKAAKTLYEGARDVFEHVRVTAQRLVKLFVEAVTRVLAWVDEHKAYLFLKAAVAAGVVALGVALNLWGLVELEKLAYAASLTPFVAGLADAWERAAGVGSREEMLRILRSAPDPYEKFREIAKAANAGKVKLAEPWESLRVLIMPRPSEERKLMWGGGVTLYSKYREDENYKRALFYAVFALEGAFGVYRSALGEYAEGLKKAVRREEVGEETFKKVVYMPDLGQLKQLAKEESRAFEDALKVLRERLNEYAVRHGLRDLLDVKEGVARGLAEAKAPKLSEFGGVNFGIKAYAALIAYREYALGGRGAFGAAVWHWLEVGGSAWLLYYAPVTAYIKAKKAEVGRPVAVEEMLVEALRRLFLKPGADHYHSFVKELTKGGKLALMLENEAESSYVFKLYNMKEGGKLVELEGVKLRITKVGKRKGEEAGITYTLELGARWRELAKRELEAAEKAAEEVGGRLPVKDSLLYMAGWDTSDVAISRNKKGEGVLVMDTSHLWQLAETYALFGWSYVTVHGVSLTLEGPKPRFHTRTSLGELDRAIKKSAEDGWLKMLGVEAESWDGLKWWVADHWGEVLGAVNERLKEGVEIGSGFDLAGALEELKGLKSRLDDDKIAREVIAPTLLLIQAEKLGVNKETLRYFAAVASGAIGGDGYVSKAMGEVVLTSGKRAVALLWGAALAAHGIKAEVRRTWNAFEVVASGGGAARLASLYFLYGPPLLEGGGHRLKNHKLAEAVELGAEGISISWEGLRRTEKGLIAADLTILADDIIKIKYNVYLHSDKISLQFASTDRSRVEQAARLLRLAGVTAEVRKEGSRDVWYVVATTDMLAAGREELRKTLAQIVKKAVENGWVEAGKAEGWLEKLERGRTLMEGWPKCHVGLSSSGGLEVRFSSPNLDSIVREAQRLEKMGLVEGVHFVVKMPEGGKAGYVLVLKEGLAYAAWLSVYGSGRQRELAAEFVEYILQRAEEAGEEVYEKTRKIIVEGMSRGSLTLKGFEKEVEVDGRRHVVKVIGGGAELKEMQVGKLLLRIKITAEVDGVRSKYAVTFGRYRGNEARGFAYARTDVPGGREADAERFSALIKALTGREPKVYQKSGGKIMMKCSRWHLEGFARYAELADDIERWLEETSRKHDTDGGLEEG